MKLYLSGPMTGLAHFNAPQFNAVAHQLRSEGYDVINPVEEDLKRGIDTRGMKGDPAEMAPFGHSAGSLIGEDVKHIIDGDFDGIVLLSGWARSKGSRIELTPFIVLGKRVFVWSNGLRELQRQQAITALAEALR